MKNNRINTHFFNFRLFLEALKRLRVIGLAAAILALTASALVPTVTWIERGSYIRTEIYEMETEFLCVPAGIMVLMAPLFFAVLFSFLQKRKESDFFHAIPYTRTCVYISFVTAALAFVWVIQIACGLTAGILWGMIPRLTADIGGMIAYVAISMLAAAMLSAFMMLALTVSGTGGSCILLFLLFASFVRVVCAVFLGCLDTMFLMNTNSMWDASVLSPLWFLPVNVLYYLGGYSEAASLLYRLPNILYSLGVTLAVFGFAGFLYNRRKSEMAGNPAPGVKTQALFRILFTTLPALLIPLFIISGENDVALMLVLVVGVLLVYFLYELITTKRPKNLLKAFPGLGIVAGICVAFSLTFAAYHTVTVNEKITADEVKWISMEYNGFLGGSYQDCLSDSLRIDDSEIIKTVTDRLAVSQKYEREGTGHYGFAVPDDWFDRMNVTIRLKGGRTLHRYISMGKTARETVRTRFAAMEEVRQIMYLLPTDGEVQSGGIEMGEWGDRDYIHMENDDTLRALLSVFRAEFETLSEAQKDQIMVSVRDRYDYGSPSTGFTMTLSLRGTAKGRRFGSDYTITDALPKTREAMVALWGENHLSDNYYSVAGNGMHGSPQTVLAAFGHDAEDPEFTKTFGYLKGYVTLAGLSSDGKEMNTSFYLAAKDYARFAELLQDTCAITQSTKESEFTLTEDTYYLYLYNDQGIKYTDISLNLRGVFRFTSAELEELTEILMIGK